MRDAKLAAIREGEGTHTPRTARGEQSRAVALEELDGGIRQQEPPLERLARVTRVERAPAGRENRPPAAEMSLERASLLSFIAGEVRRR